MKNKRWNQRSFLIVFSSLLFFSCTGKKEGKTETSENNEKLNILWIYLEDTAPLLSSYGTTLISTPNIDSLAKKGVLYTNCDYAGSCLFRNSL